MIDLKELMEERSAVPPGASVIRYPQISRRITTRRRRRVALTAVTCAAVLAIAGGYTALPRDAVDPTPANTAPTFTGGFPAYAQGARLTGYASAPVPSGAVSLTWTPSTSDIFVAVACRGVPRDMAVLSTLDLNGPYGGFNCRDETIFFRYGQIPPTFSDPRVRVGEPNTLALTLDSGIPVPGASPGAMPTSGTLELAVYERVPFAEYPLPTRPGALKPLDSAKTCANDQVLRSDPRDPGKPVSVVTQWRDQLMVSLASQTPGLLHVTFDGVAVSSAEWWDYDATPQGRTWHTELPPGTVASGWSSPGLGEPFTVTVTPLHVTGDWQVTVGHRVTGPDEVTNCR